MERPAQDATWGQTSNTFSGPGGTEHDGEVARLDYILYRVSAQKSAQTVHYRTVKQFAHQSDGSEVSLSDHDWVEATIKLSF